MTIKEPSTVFARPIRSQLYISALIFISSIVTGMSIGHSAVLLPHLQLENNSLLIDENMGSWIASVYTIVGPAGAILGGIACDAWGRKTTYIIGDVCMLVGWIVITSAQSGTMILLGRIFEGVSRTVRATSKTVLADELSDPRFRGLMLCGIYTSVSLGIVAISGFGAFLQWRVASGLATVLASMTLIMFLFIYESPTWLIRKNKMKRAEKVLKSLWGPGREEQAIEELMDLKTRLRVKENASPSSIKQQMMKSVKLFLRPYVLKPFLIMHFFNAIQAFCGISLFTYYSVDILSKTSKFETKILDDYYSNILISSLRTLAIFLSCYLIFSIGRRKLAIASGICSFVPAIIVGFLLLPSKANDENDAVRSTLTEAYITYILIITYAIGMSLGLFILPGIMIGETQYYKIRGFVCGYIYATNDLILGGVLKLYPWLMTTFDIHGIFFMFGVSCVICTIFVYLFVPETRGLTLEQIEDYFRQPNILWITRKKEYSINENKNVEKGVDSTKTLL